MSWVVSNTITQNIYTSSYWTYNNLNRATRAGSFFTMKTQFLRFTSMTHGLNRQASGEEEHTISIEYMLNIKWKIYLHIHPRTSIGAKHCYSSCWGYLHSMYSTPVPQIDWVKFLALKETTTRAYHKTWNLKFPCLNTWPSWLKQCTSFFLVLVITQVMHYNLAINANIWYFHTSDQRSYLNYNRNSRKPT